MKHCMCISYINFTKQLLKNFSLGPNNIVQGVLEQCGFKQCGFTIAWLTFWSQIFNFIVKLARFFAIARFSAHAQVQIQIAWFRISCKIIWTHFHAIRGSPVLLIAGSFQVIQSGSSSRCWKVDHSHCPIILNLKRTYYIHTYVDILDK